KFDAHLISQAMGICVAQIPNHLRFGTPKSQITKDALYKTTGQEIELFTDDNMYLFCEKGIRGEEAKKNLFTWLLYVDANALYTEAMMQSMPTGGHRWITPEKTPDLFDKITKCEIPNDALKGYILEVDLDYPYKLHKAHTSYPLAPENIEISKEEMSKYGQEIINDLKHYSKTKKLVSNLNDKKKYIVHYRVLQFYIKQGMVLRKIHRGIEFDQNFVRPEGESKKFKRLVADPSYKSHRILAENLVGISRHQTKARLSKPIFIGITVLDESKITMYNFYYNVMKKRYGDNVDDYKPDYLVYQALRKEKMGLNKKVPGKYKDESSGTAMWKFCGPRPKLYSYILADGKTDRRAKGVQKVVVKKNLTHDMYENCLKSRKECMVTMHRLGSKDHIIRLLRSSKIGIIYILQKMTSTKVGSKSHYSAIKKSRYFKLQEQLNKLENKFDILDDDLLEFKWEIDDIKKTLSLIKSSNTKFFKNSGTLSESDLSDNRGASV
ncbi:20733_t:CDS:2, partial [Dentiscutata erythropus]